MRWSAVTVSVLILLAMGCSDTSGDGGPAPSGADEGSTCNPISRPAGDIPEGVTIKLGTPTFVITLNDAIRVQFQFPNDPP
ncbi:hypothetical protein [Kribbella sp. NPDC048928]|uniref:hypothetical protein n=1 Tax=Kribbella sp. NPDC048928 TaxID=3364111 RepID=UPI00371EEDA8